MALCQNCGILAYQRDRSDRSYEHLYHINDQQERITAMERIINPLLKYFKSNHLPQPLRKVSDACAGLANMLDHQLPDCDEKTRGLRKLLEAKDCFVLAALGSEEGSSDES
jgi:hypothetical protein